MTLLDAQVEFRHRLLSAGLLLSTGVDGLYGRSGTFESIVAGVDRVVATADPDNTYESMRFAPMVARAVFEQTGYLASFPDLVGSVHSFKGDDAGHARLLALLESGQDWTQELEPSEVMLVPAVCHPVYPVLSGTLGEDGRRIDIDGYCFRHEPSVDPARMQAFRMHEFVRVGTPLQALEHRDAWVDRGLEVLSVLGLDARSEVANDPFFGRAGRILAVNQREENLKIELVVHLYDGEGPGTPVVSSNCHRDHFGEPFGIRTADGATAHSACVGFGMERITLALLSKHGLDPATWPLPVRRRMWP